MMRTHLIDQESWKCMACDTEYVGAYQFECEACGEVKNEVWHRRGVKVSFEERGVIADTRRSLRRLKRTILYMVSALVYLTSALVIGHSGFMYWALGFSLKSGTMAIDAFYAFIIIGGFGFLLWRLVKSLALMLSSYIIDGFVSG